MNTGRLILGNIVMGCAVMGLTSGLPAQGASKPPQSPPVQAVDQSTTNNDEKSSDKIKTKDAAPTVETAEGEVPKVEADAEAAKAEKTETDDTPKPAVAQNGTAANAAAPVPFDKRIAELTAKKLGGTPGASKSAAAYYRALGNEPLWVNEGGWLPAAKAVAAEIKRADNWGLDSSAFSLPDFAAGLSSDDDFAKAEVRLSRAAIKYARHARGGRVDPTKLSRFIDRAPTLPAPRDVLDELARASDKAARLAGYQPKHPQFLALKTRLNKLRGKTGNSPMVRLPAGPVLRKGSQHSQVAQLRKRLGLKPGGSPTSFDATVENGVKAFQREQGLRIDGVVGNRTRRVLNGRGPEKQIVKLLINMERWRSLPDDLASGAGIFVWANIPEFRTRVMRDGKAIFSERSIVGLLNKQTPVFSDKMEWIEFHPTWFVPASIKREDILPSLRRPTSTIVERYHLKISCGAAGNNPKAIDWSKQDITQCRITQPAGPKSVLGDFKFKFPNKHAVYMHDTLTRRLFSASIRTFSHGCIRIKNPKRMAQILLEHQNIMGKSRIDAILAGPRRMRKARFKTPVPVHITYLTALIDDSGKFVTRPDYYGHDRRLAQALLGKGHLIDAAPVAKRSTYRPKPRPKKKKRDWTDQVLYN